MERFSPEPDLALAWKCHPLRLLVPEPSKCHGMPRLIAQSMDGGFVSANCSECGAKEPFGDADLRNLGCSYWLACPVCRGRMVAGRVPGSSGKPGQNYGLTCEACKLYLWLSDLVPRWEDL